MAKPGEIPTGVAESLFSQFCLDAAQAVLPPHGAAPVGDGHNGAAVYIFKNMAQVVTQLARQGAVVGGGSFVHQHIPFFAAAVGTGGGDATEGIVIGGFGNQHGVSP